MPLSMKLAVFLKEIGTQSSDKGSSGYTMYQKFTVGKFDKASSRSLIVEMYFESWYDLHPT